MSPPVLSTPRLRLREFAAQNASDSVFLREILTDPAFIANVGDRGVRTDDDAGNYMRDRILPSYRANGFGMWVVELHQTNEPIGICGLLKRDNLPDIDIGFSFLERYRGNGYAFEAAHATLEYAWQHINLSRVVAIVAPHNTRSIHLLEKLGLRFDKMIQLPPNEREICLYAIDRP